MSLPVSRHATPRSRDRLVDRMVMWRRQLWTVDVLLRRVVEEPVLAGLIALDDGVSAFLRMVARVLGWGGVAATDVTAACASTKVEPPTAGRKALDAACAAGRHRRIDIHFLIIPEQQPPGSQGRGRIPRVPAPAGSPWNSEPRVPAPAGNSGSRISLSRKCGRGSPF